jgi:tRNA A37 threonylcarbamoyladenosine biosynthesis protein TsaE
MIQRELQETIASSLKKYPVVGLIGSRQAGKTTLAKIILNSSSKICLGIFSSLWRDILSIMP